MTSHEYADKLQQVVDLLREAEEFEMPDYIPGSIAKYGCISIRFFNDKNPFLKAVEAIGKGTKRVVDNTFEFVVGDGVLRLTVDRLQVCTLVKPAQLAEYECEPLLSQIEEAQVG